MAVRRFQTIAVRAAGAAVAGVGLVYLAKRALEAEAPIRLRNLMKGEPAVDHAHMREVVLATAPAEGGEPRRRVVTFREHGDPRGVPILVLPSPASGRLELISACAEPSDVTLPPGIASPASGSGPADSPSKAAGARVIVLDRPGYGGSTDSAPLDGPGALQDVAAWVLAVADALELDRFAVVGLGASSGYALACADSLPSIAPGRLVGVAMVSPEGPWKGFAPSRSRRLPSPDAARLRAEALQHTSAEGIAGRTMGWLSARAPAAAETVLLAVRRGVLSDPAVAARGGVTALRRGGDRADAARLSAALEVGGALLAVGALEGMRPGVAGVRSDAAALSGYPWDVDCGDVVDPWGGEGGEGGEGGGFVQLWCGDTDALARPEWAEALAAALPADARSLVRVPRCGHWALLADHWGDVVASLAARFGATAGQDRA